MRLVTKLDWSRRWVDDENNLMFDAWVYRWTGERTAPDPHAETRYDLTLAITPYASYPGQEKRIWSRQIVIGFGDEGLAKWEALIENPLPWFIEGMM